MVVSVMQSIAGTLGASWCAGKKCTCITTFDTALLQSYSRDRMTEGDEMSDSDVDDVDDGKVFLLSFATFLEYIITSLSLGSPRSQHRTNQTPES